MGLRPRCANRRRSSCGHPSTIPDKLSPELMPKKKRKKNELKFSSNISLSDTTTNQTSPQYHLTIIVHFLFRLYHYPLIQKS